MIISISKISGAVEDTTGYYKFHNDTNKGAFLFGDSDLTDDIVVSY